MEDASDLWILSYPSGRRRKLGVISIASGAAWFPDSRHLLVMTDTGDGFEVVDSADGSRRVLYRGPDNFESPSLSPDGKKIAFGVGSVEGDVLEISLPDGRVRTVAGGRGVSFCADWAPSGTHYLVTVAFQGTQHWAVEDRSTADNFARRVAEVPGSIGDATAARWSPDGARFVFTQSDAIGKSKLTIADASGSRLTPVVDVTNAPFPSYAWSPDSQWIAFMSMESGKQRIFKVRAAAGSMPEVLSRALPVLTEYEFVQWSPRGDRILYSDGDGISSISPDGQTVRKVTARKLLGYGFSRDGVQVFGVLSNITGDGAQWQLYSVSVDTGVEKMLAALDLPTSTQGLSGFSLHPDGKRFLTTVGKWPYDIWILEGFDQPKPWLNRLLRR